MEKLLQDLKELKELQKAQELASLRVTQKILEMQAEIEKRRLAIKNSKPA